MAYNLDEGLVQFGMLRFELGSGTFMRNKFVFVHFNGAGLMLESSSRCRTEGTAAWPVGLLACLRTCALVRHTAADARGQTHARESAPWPRVPVTC